MDHPVSDARICTIGHSNRSIDEFIALLRANEIACVLDIRTVPKSRHNPQFGQDQLPQSLAQAGIGYRYIAGLGGLRRARKDSLLNAGWRNMSFRGYADYMQTEEFAQNVDLVVDLAQRERVALMCAEAVPWRCHRSLVADALVVRGVPVDEIIGPQPRRPHKLTRFAQVEGLKITYPPEETTDNDTAEVIGDASDEAPEDAAASAATSPGEPAQADWIGAKPPVRSRAPRPSSTRRSGR